MALLEEIKQRIEALSEGEFQTLCDAYLSSIGYPDLVSLGTKSGTKKTTKGTPDTYIRSSNGKYIFVEYTTQKSNLVQKIIDDLEKCFNEEETGIKCSDIDKVLYFHTSSNITPKQDKKIHDYAEQHNVFVELTGIDTFSNVLFNNHKFLVKKYLGIPISTDQIFTKEEFVLKYDKAPTAAPLNTSFMFRQQETNDIKTALSEYNAVLLSGDAGIGKTRLALETAEQYAIENEYQFLVIRNNNERLWDDLNIYFQKNGRYIILIDDANQISNLKTYLEFLRDRSDNIKLIITVRKYALEDVSTKADAVMKNKLIQIEKLNETEIEEMIANSYDLNTYALDKISDLSNGNPRIAFLAGKYASETNSISAINNIPELYKNYYGTFLKEQDIDENLLKCAGIVAFIKRINLDHLPKIKDLLECCNITTDDFTSGIHKLHDLEIIDIYKDKGVKYSDQCLSDFILYDVFIEKKIISLAAFTELLFEKSEDQTVQSINILTSNFYSEDNFKFIKSEMKIVWDKLKTNKPYCFEKFFMRFHPLFSIDSLIIINEKIEQAIPKPIDAEELKAVPKYNRYTSDWLDVLASYGSNPNAEEFNNAVELLLMYFLKCPANYNDVLSYGKQLSSIRKIHLQHDYFGNQIAFVNKLIEKSENWTNRYISVLFLDLAEHFLKLRFEQTENKHGSISYIYGEMPYSEELCVFRQIVWQELVKLSDDISNSDRILDVIIHYGDGIQDNNKDFLKIDLPYIAKILYSLYSCNSTQAIIGVEHVQMICNAFNYASFELDQFYKTEKYQLYHLLDDRHTEVKGWEERKSHKEDCIREYICNSPETALISIIDLGYDLKRIGKLEYEVEESIGMAFNCAYNDKDVFLKAVKYYLTKWDFNDVLYPPVIVSKLFNFLDDEAVREIIILANDVIINNWEFAYYYELPEELIDAEKCNELLYFFTENSDSYITSSPLRRLEFLSKYEKCDRDIYIKACEIILKKRGYSHYIIHLYFDLLFNEYNIKPDELVSKFGNNLDLLSAMYLEMIFQNGFDYSGKYLVAIIQAYPPMLDKYMLCYKENRQILSYNVLERLAFLVNLDNYIEVFDRIMDSLLEIPFISMTISSLFDNHYNSKNTIFTDKIVLWMKHYIELYYADIEKMRLIFEINAYIELKSRVDVIIYYLSKNNDFEAFKELYLFPTSSCWTGSELPLIQDEIDFLEKLKSQLTEVSYLQHKSYINKLIDSKEKYKESTQIEEMLGRN